MGSWHNPQCNVHSCPDFGLRIRFTLLPLTICCLQWVFHFASCCYFAVLCLLSLFFMFFPLLLSAVAGELSLFPCVSQLCWVLSRSLFSVPFSRRCEKHKNKELQLQKKYNTTQINKTNGAIIFVRLARTPGHLGLIPAPAMPRLFTDRPFGGGQRHCCCCRVLGY